MPAEYEWLRKDDETSVAYAAFRMYLDMGDDRTIAKVCEGTGKSWQLMTRWSSMHSWVERVRAFDRHLKAAETDGLVSQLAESRDKNLALMDKLRDHLSTRLNYFILKSVDPTMLWTQALVAMARVEQNSLLMAERSTGKTSEQITRVEALVETLQREFAGGADDQ